MKTFILALFIILLSYKIQAQIFAGGSVGIEFSNKEEIANSSIINYDYSQISINPLMGFYVSKKDVVGFQLGYGYGKKESKSNNSLNYTSNSFTFTPFYRRYIKFSDLFKFFSQFYLSYSYKDIDDLNKENNINSYAIGYKPGILLKVNKLLTLSFKFGNIYYKYSKTNLETLENKKLEPINKNFNIKWNQISVGLSYKIK